MPTLRLADYLREDLIVWDLTCADKPSFLAALAEQVHARIPEVEEKDLLARLLERESEQSTGVGGGLALPHAVVPGLDRTLLVAGRTHDGVDFGALDAEPVDVFFLLLSPPEERAEHLRVLARLARICILERLLGNLRGATGPKQLFEILIDEDARHVY